MRRLLVFADESANPVLREIGRIETIQDQPQHSGRGVLVHLGTSAIQVRLQRFRGGDFSQRIKNAGIPLDEWVLILQERYGLVLRPLEAREASGRELAIGVRFGGNDPEVLPARVIVKRIEVCLASVEAHVLRRQIESSPLHFDQGRHMSGFLFRKAKREDDIGYVDRSRTLSRIVPFRKIPVAFAGQFETVLGPVRRKNLRDEILFGLG